jgi:hypothetical protein
MVVTLTPLGARSMRIPSRNVVRKAARRFEYPRDLHPHFSSLIAFGKYSLQLPI